MENIKACKADQVLPDATEVVLDAHCLVLPGSLGSRVLVHCDGLKELRLRHQPEFHVDRVTLPGAIIDVVAL